MICFFCISRGKRPQILSLWGCSGGGFLAHSGATVSEGSNKFRNKHCPKHCPSVDQEESNRSVGSPPSFCIKLCAKASVLKPFKWDPWKKKKPQNLFSMKPFQLLLQLSCFTDRGRNPQLHFKLGIRRPEGLRLFSGRVLREMTQSYINSTISYLLLLLLSLTLKLGSGEAARPLSVWRSRGEASHWCFYEYFIAQSSNLSVPLQMLS